MIRRWMTLLLCLQFFWVCGCVPSEGSSVPAQTKTTTEIKLVQVATSTPTMTATQTAVLTTTSTSTSTATIIPDPQGCWRPPDDYQRMTINGQTLNARTFYMLSHAADLYGGVIDITGTGITQGSYTDEEPLSFGTHAGGGAVDISVIAWERFEILYDEIDPLIHALRVAGFAAWLRDVGELADYSPIHIHAIAIGDAELSPAAHDQLTGQFGYFRGFNGIPTDDGVPIIDPHGGPILCEWMREMGYADLREESH